MYFTEISRLSAEKSAEASLHEGIQDEIIQVDKRLIIRVGEARLPIDECWMNG